MSDRQAAARGIEPLGIFKGFAVAGCEPDEMGIGPVFAIPKLLKQTGKKSKILIFGNLMRPSPCR